MAKVTIQIKGFLSQLLKKSEARDGSVLGPPVSYESGMSWSTQWFCQGLESSRGADLSIEGVVGPVLVCAAPVRCQYLKR